MEVQSQSPVKIVLRLQESPDEDLDVAAAFAKQPDAVRGALLEAIRRVQLQSTDITLLRIENVFQSTLKIPWKEPRNLRPVLEACRQKKLKSRTESLFFKHGKEYGVVALCAATKPDNHKLFREIDQLQDEQLIRLIGNVQKLPKKASIVEFVEEFVQTPEGIVSDPPPQLTRPRMRRKGNFTPIGHSRSPSPQETDPATSEIHQSNKRRRLNRREVPAGDGPRDSFQTHLRLPPPYDAGLSAPHQTPNTTAISSYLLQPNTLNPEHSQRAGLVQPETANLSQSQYTRQVMSFKAGEGLQQRSEQEERLPMIQPDDLWHIPGRDFIPGRPAMFDGQASQISGQEEEWDIPGREFVPGRPPVFDGQISRMLGQGEEWDIPGREFIPGRPLMFDGQTPQILVQGEEWDILGREFVPGRPPVFDGQAPQMLGQGEEWGILGREFVPGRPHIYNGQGPQTRQHDFRFQNS